MHTVAIFPTILYKSVSQLATSARHLVAMSQPLAHLNWPTYEVCPLQQVYAGTAGS